MVSLNGYGVRIAVQRGQLALADGIGQNRRAARFSRATCGIRRLVVRGSAYFITGDAINWLADIGASFLNLGFDGEILVQWTPPGHDDARLRRAQALAPWTDAGTELVRHLLREKLLGQAHVLSRYFPHATDPQADVRACLAELDSIDDPQFIRKLEADAASAYWSAWADVPVRFARRDAASVPEHWLAFGSRTSPLTNKPHQAVNPANAMLNYLYAILEGETYAACVTAGLDPGLGLFHTDVRKRPSLVLDLMEPVRPSVDAWLLDTLAHRAWTRDDFGEIRSGVCRALPPLTHALAETALTWYRAVGPHVEHVARTLFAKSTDLSLPSGLASRSRSDGHSRTAAPTEKPYPTRLTRANHRASRAPFRSSVGPARTLSPKIPSACHGCGVVLDDPDRMYCADCLPMFITERAQRFQSAGQARLQALTESGEDPRGSKEARKKRSARLTEHHRAMEAWEQQYGAASTFDTTIFTERIYPALQNTKTSDIIAATGLSQPYCRRIRHGECILHPMHWQALAQLVGIVWEPEPQRQPRRRQALPRMEQTPVES